MRGGGCIVTSKEGDETMANPQRARPLTFAVFQAILLTPLGLLAGILYSFGGFGIDTLVSLGWIETMETPGLSSGTLLAFLALIAMPAITAVVGFAVGLVEALLYNLFGRWIGDLDTGFEKADGLAAGK